MFSGASEVEDQEMNNHEPELQKRSELQKEDSPSPTVSPPANSSADSEWKNSTAKAKKKILQVG